MPQIISKNEKIKLNNAKKQARKFQVEELKRVAIERKKNDEKTRILSKELTKNIKNDLVNQKKYQKEIKDFLKKDKTLIKQRIKEVEDWYLSVEKNKNNKKIYKYKLSQAKIANYDYSDDIIFENVSYTYSRKTPFEFRALDNADLMIKKGIITAVIGTTGSGKSTLIQLINGLLIADIGRVKIGNFQLPATTKKITEIKSLRKEIGLVFQFPEYQLFKETIEDDISFGPVNMGVPRSEIHNNIPELLKLVDIPEEFASRSPFALSGGQKRRIAIAGIIAMDGNTLVLDEPTGGLDPQGEEDFIKLFYNLNKQKNKRIIIVTHNMDHVLRIADEVIVMHEGKLIKKGTPFEIFNNHELLKKINIEPPKLYQLAYKLKEKKIDITNEKFRSITDFVNVLKEKRGK